jgi:ribose 5-phosphate isomerase A
MTQDELKIQVAQAAIPYVAALAASHRGLVIGVGTGSTVNAFIDALGRMQPPLAGAVSSSERSSERLRALGIPVLDANQVEGLPLYVDGADEIDSTGCMIKGGGAALTREKIVADLAERFVCIADASKQVATLGRFPLPVEVIPMACAQVTRALAGLGGRAVLRAGLTTDNGNLILDVHGLVIGDPPAMEREINQWPGVVSVGIFARNRANLCLLGTAQGVQTLAF